jgi:hypothetical protein
MIEGHTYKTMHMLKFMKMNPKCPLSLASRNDFWRYIGCDAVSAEVISKLAKEFDISAASLKAWIVHKSIPTKADLFVATALLFKVKVYFNYHIESALKELSTFSHQEIYDYFVGSLLRKLYRDNIISKDVLYRHESILESLSSTCSRSER